VSALRVDPAAAGLTGQLRVPGDKSISHRALLLAALGEGTSTVHGLSGGADVQATLRAVRAFGADVEAREDGGMVIHGGRDRLHEPDHVIDVGNSGTGIRLLTGWATGIEGITILEGDASIARRPMGRVVEPLRSMGAHIDGRHRGQLPPLVIRGGELIGIDYQLNVPSAQVKGAVLLAALAAGSPTTVREALPTRAHTEEMLAACGVRVDIPPGAVTVHPGPVAPGRFEIPADPSQAAFWVVAACIIPGSDLTLTDVYVGPQRAAFLDVLARMGADVDVTAPDPVTRAATIRARHAPLRGTDVGGAEVPGLIDEIPVLAVAAAYADGVTVFADAEELKVKESDRIATTVSALRTLGAEAEGRPDGLVVKGGSGRRLAGGRVDSAGDHRVAMAAAVAALAGSEPVVIDGWDAVETSYPGFEKDMDRCLSRS
jgi:3-phosphoshikimate 1-carboxyvinyltransferase